MMNTTFITSILSAISKSLSRTKRDNSFSWPFMDKLEKPPKKWEGVLPFGIAQDEQFCFGTTLLIQSIKQSHLIKKLGAAINA